MPSVERPHWPNGARCAVTLTFDNFGESYDLLKFGFAGGAFADGIYAPRRGVERVMEMLERFGVPGTFFLEGWNVRKYASLAREIEARGHEVAAHGWMHETWNQLGPKEEEDLLRRTTETFGEVLGHAPRGWRGPSGYVTPRTMGLVYDLGYRYDSATVDDDVPYMMRVGPDRAEEIVELPMAWQYDDASYYGFPGVAIRRPSEVAELWMEEFDALYRETGYFMLVCHPRYSGRPPRIVALERLISHMQERDAVWFARCEEVAELVRSSPTTPHYDFPALA
jgi:peptidoglycan/xylan/chitin deacetylase (PgdA/CDA1 family)